jgi:hypothetical protein
MRLITQSSSQLHTLFGGAYVIEQRSDETQRHLPPPDEPEYVLDFSNILDSLRAALSLR